MLSYRPPGLGDRLRPVSRKAPWEPSKVQMGSSLVKELGDRAWEFEEPLKFVTVDSAWVLGDLLLHQVFHSTAGDKTPPMYYGNKWLWGIPFLLVGRLLSEHVIKGSPLVRAATIGTTANLMMQGRYLLSGLSPEFNAIVFLIHEALLVPLSFLLVRDPRAPKY